VDESNPVNVLKLAQAQLGLKILELHRKIWPKGVNGTYKVVDYDGRARVEFEMPAVKEPNPLT
jgi:hypothetical protein